LKMLKIGIVTISYNQGEYLAEAIQSVRMHDARQLKYVMVDPGSTDDSRTIIEKFKPRFSDVILTPDRGPADGLNNGFACLEDVDILGYINADDFFADNALNFVVNFFEQHPGVDVLTGGIKLIDSNYRVLRRGRVSAPFDFPKFAAQCCLICQQATFFRRAAFAQTSGFNINNKTCWDGELIVDLALSGCKFATVPKVLGYFRRHKASITTRHQLSRSQQFLEDWHQIRMKMQKNGITLYPSFVERIHKLIYKVNPVRQIPYLLVK
jgi:glycosyltransferase involved in cell wall biosynthesis